MDSLHNKPEQEPVAIYQYKMGDGSWIDQEKHSYDYNKRYAPNATVRVVYTTPPQRKPLTDEMVLAGARALAKRHADSCGLDFDDVWKYYAEEHKDDAKAVIEATHGIKGEA